MKKSFLFILTSVLLTSISFAQAKKPKIMVVPSKQWCQEKGFIRNYDNQGVTEYIADWEAALVKTPNLKTAMVKMGTEMQKSGFLLESLEQTIDGIKQDRIEEQVNNIKVSSSPIDQVRAKAKADIEIHVYWKIESQGPRKRITEFILEGIDTYTNKQVASATGSGNWASSSDVSDADLLLEAIQSKMDGFKSTLQMSFDEMFKNGREITMDMYVTEAWGKDFTTEDYGGDELQFLISDWLASNTVQGRFGSPAGSETRLLINGIRIPLYNNNNQAMDAAGFARGFKSYLKSIGIDQVKIDPVGLGKVKIFIGPK
jgi:hypothetical protein